ncbi:MAG: DnaA/Hda family protein, partial [Chloroflexota bacterium]
MNQDHIWTAVQEELRFQLAKPSYETWLKNTNLVSAEGSTFRIGVPSKLAKDWLEDRFAGLIQETLQAVTGGEVEVDFVVSPSGLRASAHDDPPAGLVEELIPEEPTHPAELNEKFKFSSFVVGNNSRFAHAAAKAVADAPGEHYNPLFLYGGVGLGKTHL